MPTSDRLLKLQEMLQRTPSDAFLLYGIAMEHKKLGEMDKAIDYFSQTIAADNGYCYAYYQRAQTYEQMGQTDQARQSYVDGVAAAKRVGDAHAKEELETALGMIG